MVTDMDNEEHLSGSAVQTQPASGTEQPGRESKAEVQSSSVEQGEVSELDKKLAAMKADLSREWKANSDRENQKLYAKIKELEAEKQTRQREIQQAEEERKLDAQVSRYIEEGADETEALSYKEAVKKWRKGITQFNLDQTALEERRNANEAELAESRATKLLHKWQMAHLDKPIDFEAALSYLVTKGKGDSDVMAELVEPAAIKFPFKPAGTDESTFTKEKPHRPDSSHGVPVGKSLSNLAPKDRVREADRRLREAQK